MSILQMSLSISPSSRVLSGPNYLFLTTKRPSLSLHTTTRKPTVIRMGGGPRTFPGGVSKWQWKRMQANKAKQLLKARLARERQIYEMRKRAELKAAVSELERPWEVVEKAPKLFSVAADEQVKVLADRFQRPGGFDMWSEKDGPQVFSPDDRVPSARFFPKGVVHSIKPYGKIDKDLLLDDVGNLDLFGLISEPVNDNEKNGLIVNGIVKGSNPISEPVNSNKRNGSTVNGKLRNSGRRIRSGVKNSKDLNGLVSGGVGVDGERRRETPARHSGNNWPRRGRGLQQSRGPNLDAFDMSVQNDGWRKNGKGTRPRPGVENPNDLNSLVSRGVGVDWEQRRETPARRSGNSWPSRGRGSQKLKGPNSEVFDMREQNDGWRKKGKSTRTRPGVENSNDLNSLVSGGVGVDWKQRRETPTRRVGNNRFTRGRGSQELRGPNSEVFDVGREHDGSCGFLAEK